LAANGPSAGPVFTASSAAPAFSSTPPLGCISFTGGPCVTLCVDGQWSSSIGPGTCSFHGGEASSVNPTRVPPLGCISFTGGPCITLCVDGQWSSSIGPGTCSFHGGEA
jgi:hypothetical protein